MKIATWNVNSLKVRLPHVLEWLAANEPDVLVLQEIKQVTEMFPSAEFLEAGYQSVASGQKTYNGVAVIAKQIPADPVTDFTVGIDFSLPSPIQDILFDPSDPADALFPARYTNGLVWHASDPEVFAAAATDKASPILARIE